MSLTDRLDSIYNTFSRRSKPKGKGYSPDAVGATTRNRVLLLIRDVYSGKWQASNRHGDYLAEFWDQIHNLLEHLYGRARLSEEPRVNSAFEDMYAFVTRCTPAEFFDFIEGIFKIECTRQIFWDSNELVEALNNILRSDGAPYQLTPTVTREEPSAGPYGQGTAIITVALPNVIRVDDEVTHAEAVLPALSILVDPAYAGANDEFRKALADYRQDDFEDCLVKCGAAFESVLKVICSKNKIPYDPNKDTVGPLLDKVLLESKLDTATFKEPLMGIGRLRNRLSAAHGGGAKVKTVERHVAQYTLTSTAAAIVLVVRDMGQ